MAALEEVGPFPPIVQAPEQALVVLWETPGEVEVGTEVADDASARIVNDLRPMEIAQRVAYMLTRHVDLKDTRPMLEATPEGYVCYLKPQSGGYPQVSLPTGLSHTGVKVLVHHVIWRFENGFARSSSTCRIFSSLV